METIIINFQLSVNILSLFEEKIVFGIDELDQFNLEQRLRELNFGYRARYIHEAVRFLKYTVDDTTFFDQLKSLPATEARIHLSQIMGVGRKVNRRISSLLFFARLSRLPIVSF